MGELNKTTPKKERAMGEVKKSLLLFVGLCSMGRKEVQWLHTKADIGHEGTVLCLSLSECL